VQSLADTPSVGIALHSETRHQCNQLQIAPEETASVYAIIQPKTVRQLAGRFLKTC
jgi:hypothetical protein